MDAKKSKRLRGLRVFSQFFFICSFFYLLLQSGGIAIEHLPHTGFFFYIDPLFLWVNFLAGPFLSVFLLALVPLFLTLVLGRFFCGWVCPFGALNQFFTWLGSRRGRKKLPVARGPLRLKYLLLIILLVASLFASQLLGWIDPLALLTRSTSTVVLPGANFLLQHSLHTGAQSRGWQSVIVKPLYDLSRRFLLTVSQRTFLQTWAIGLLFFGLLLLIILMVASLFASQLLGWIDPLALLTRSTSTVVLPGANFLLQHSLKTGAQSRGWQSVIVKPLYDLSRRFLLTVSQRTFLQTWAIGLLFFGLLLLNFHRRRFFCNTLCPLGALYGWLAKYSLVRLSLNENCRQCGACANHCTYYGSPYQDYLKSECVLCLNCLVDCPYEAIDVSFELPTAGKRPALDMGRRRILAAAGCGLAVAALPQVSVGKKTKDHHFIRPPGAAAEKDFLKKCIRCGACMQACPTNAIQPAVFQAGLEGLWTPILVPVNGYCEYECFRCTRVCPTHAIASLTLEEKKQFKIGTAVINRSACYTYADGYNCAVCEEHCPVPEKAIRFRDADVLNFHGKLKKVKQIYVVPDLCIGCGICENVCPRTDAPAIVVGAEEEQREISY